MSERNNILIKLQYAYVWMQLSERIWHLCSCDTRPRFQSTASWFLDTQRNPAAFKSWTFGKHMDAHLSSSKISIWVRNFPENNSKLSVQVLHRHLREPLLWLGRTNLPGRRPSIKHIKTNTCVSFSSSGPFVSQHWCLFSVFKKQNSGKHGGKTAPRQAVFTSCDFRIRHFGRALCSVQEHHMHWANKTLGSVNASNNVYDVISKLDSWT